MPVDFDRNGEIIKALEKSAVRACSSSGYTVGGYEVRVHPDLVERLRELMIYCPKAQLEYVFGTPVLCTSAGDIFATVSGMRDLNVHLPEDVTWGRHYEEYGEPWRQGPAWARRPHTQEYEKRIASVVVSAYSARLTH